MIKVLSYGSGNVKAILGLYHRLNIRAEPATSAADLLVAERIVVPGVGAFDETMRLLNRSGMRDALESAVRERGTPVIGICVGMQIMADSSEEGSERGLGWIPGTVRRIDTTHLTEKPLLPHMGWNTLQRLRDHPILAEVDDKRGFYFLHSYCYHCADPRDVLATAQYGEPVSAIIQRGAIIGAQFHPEKSHENGISVFKNFATYKLCSEPASSHAC